MTRPKKATAPDPALNQAAALLAEIKDCQAQIAELDTAYLAELDALALRHPELAVARERLEALDKDLKALLKKNQVELFGGREKIVVTDGVLLHTREDRLTLPKDAETVARLKAAGWTEAVIVVERPDRPLIATWPIERVIAIGGDRRQVDKFGYEVL